MERSLRGAVIVCGGMSRRMGRPKALLPFGPETMLQRIVRLVGEAVSSIVVVAATDQSLPALPAETLLVHDRESDRGPLEGIAVGLSALPDQIEAAYVTACDVPRLQVAWIDYLFTQLGDHAIVVPRDDDHVHPLAAVYRRSLAATADQLIADGKRRPLDLIRRCDSLEIDVSTLRSVDPQLSSLDNINSPADYELALRRAAL